MTAPTTVPFGPLLRHLRLVAGLSQEELAERAGLSARGISALETGYRATPRPETVRLLADALGLDDAARAELVAAARPELAELAEARPRAAPAGGPPLALPLPVPPTRLVGRESEVAALCARLRREEVRLLTLTGPGGVGKTRLALAVAGEVAGAFADGVAFVPLAPITDPALVPSAIITALGVRDVGDEPLVFRLQSVLRDKRLLLLLDNFEHVVEASPIVADVLETCPGVTILVTSRVRLRVSGEHEIPVAPLGLVALDRQHSVEEVATSAAVRLFIARAEDVQPDLALTPENAAAVAAICQRLDGLPLAIELAAARIKVLPPSALLARLDHRLPLLTGGPRDLPERQQTMRQTIAWSHDLLAPEEQGLFRRLSVFAGGCTLEASEAVAGRDGTVDVFASIAALVESSLLRQEEDRAGEPRFRMLETVREYGLEQLALAGEADTARQRHAEYFRRLSASQARSTPLFVTVASMARLASDQDNLRLALAWYDQQAESDMLMQVSTELFGLWVTQGLYREGLQWIQRALEQSSRGATGPRVEALAAAGHLVLFLDDHAWASMLITEGLALARELGDPFQVAQALTNAGFLAYRRGEYDLAETQLDEARQLLSGISDTVPDAVRLSAVPFQILGDTALAREQFDLAATRYEEAIELARTIGAVWTAIDAHIGLAAVNYCTGNTVRAAALYMTHLHRAQDVGVKSLVGSALLGLAGVAAALGRPEEGARLLGAAEGSAASHGAPIFPRDRPVRDRALAALTATLGEHQLATTRAAGRALTVEEAIGEAQVVAERITASPP